MVAHEKGEFNPVAFAPFLNDLVNEATASGFRKKKKSALWCVSKRS